MKHKHTITAPFEVRAESDSNAIKYIKGYAALYNVPCIIYERGQAIQETIMPGAFDMADMSDIRCLLNHDSNFIFGRSSAATLEVGTDDTGLWYDCRLDLDIQSHSDLYKQIERGDISQSSFAFSWPKDGVTTTTTAPGEPNLREINIIDWVYDVSPVTYPAYAETSVEARSEELRAEIGNGLIQVTQEQADTISEMLMHLEAAQTTGMLLMGLQPDIKLMKMAMWWIENIGYHIGDIEVCQSNYMMPAEHIIEEETYSQTEEDATRSATIRRLIIDILK